MTEADDSALHSKVEASLEEVPGGEPRCWVRVTRPGQKTEEIRYPDLMAKPAVIAEDRAIKQEASRQQRTLVRDWKAKAMRAKAAPSFEFIRVVSDRSPYSNGFDPSKHMTIYYRVDGREHQDVPSSLDRMIRASPERFPNDTMALIRAAVGDKLASLREQCKPEDNAGEPMEEGKVEEASTPAPVTEDTATAAPVPSPTAEEAPRPPEGLELVPSGPADVSMSFETPAAHPSIVEAENINRFLAIGRGEDSSGGPEPAPSFDTVPSGTGFSIDLAEPYIEDDGSPAVAVIWNGRHLKLRKLSEWREFEPELAKVLTQRFYPDKGARWKYPSRPILPENYEDIWGENGLHSAIMRCNENYIEFPDDAWPSAFAIWVMGSYLVPYLPRSPVLPIFGPTGSGKGQVLDQVDRLAYRGKKMIDPTPAVLYRLADRWRMTFALDELQDKDKDSFREVLSIVKGSYDGTSVYRCDTNNEVEEFQTRSFFAISFKDRQPKEDVKNRGILLTMQQNGKAKKLVPDDSPEHAELRARLMGLRLKALIEPQFLEEAIKKVQEMGTPEALGFDRRPRDIALSLLVPAVMCHQEDQLTRIIRISSDEASDANNSTFEARTQHAYAELLQKTTTPGRYFSALVIRSSLQETLRMDGELRDDQTLPTRRVTDALKTLGYKLVRRSGNNPFIDREDKQNIAAFETNQKKYPVKDDTEENGSEA